MNILSGSRRELIVIARPEAGLRVRMSGLASVGDLDVTLLENFLSAERITLKPLFGTSEDRIENRVSDLAVTTNQTLPDLSLYYSVKAPDERLEEIARNLRRNEAVAAAYIKPPALPAFWPDDTVSSMDEPPPPHTRFHFKTRVS